MARLQKRTDKGEAALTFSEEHGYLDSVLENPGASASPQVLVFSKTGF